MPQRAENKIHICVIGNSVAMRVRPPRSRPENKNYTALLREEFRVDNLSAGGTTIRETHGRINEIIRIFPDYYVINLGVVDSCNREIPRWFFNRVNDSMPSFCNRSSRFVYNGFIKKIRTPLVYLRGKRSWIGAREFKNLYTNLITTLLKETNAQIIGLSINLADERVEKALPGSRKKHILYNKIIKDSLHQNACSFLDLGDMDASGLYPDGIHYNAEGHRQVAHRITQVIRGHAE